MQKSSKQPKSSELKVPELELPVLTEFARRPPLLTMDHLALNESNLLDSAETPVVPAHEKCSVPFEL